MTKIHQIHSADKWLPVSVTPPGVPVEVSLVDSTGIHALIFACCWNGAAWVGASTRKKLDIQPTHWRPWSEERSRENLAISRVWIRYGFS
jgi:hypothetical protein